MVLVVMSRDVPVIFKLVKLVSFRSELGQIDVTLGHTRATHPGGALLAKGNWILIFVQNIAGRVG